MTNQTAFNRIVGAQSDDQMITPAPKIHCTLDKTIKVESMYR